ncbi:MAG: ATP-binding protein, partial [Cyclobacteriaceae bacterium]|nr:ATP-binding protein [Cyclobacteriaceae bacterium]
MARPEHIAMDSRQLAELNRLVREGEGLHLEFKRKAAFPDKIARELIAFANTDGGTLLVGVDDDGTVTGVKFPEEELLVIEKELEAHCRPALPLHVHLVRVNEKRFVLWLEVEKSDRRPHRYVQGEKSASFVREKDQTIRASREMVEVIRRLKTLRGMKFTYGEAEQKVIRFLAD